VNDEKKKKLLSFISLYRNDLKILEFDKKAP